MCHSFFMKIKIEITDSNGLRKAQILLNRIRHFPYYSKIRSRVKAWLKVQSAVDNWNDRLISTQPKSLFNYTVEDPDRTYNCRLNESFKIMGENE
jgi:hypothetical protein